jgi:hypothetical protein
MIKQVKNAKSHRLEPASKTEILAQTSQGSKIALIPPWHLAGLNLWTRQGWERGEIYKTLLGTAVFIQP